MSKFEPVDKSLSDCPDCGGRRVKHIIKEGARYHVISWSSRGQHCSNKDCETNHGPGRCIDDPLKQFGERH